MATTKRSPRAIANEFLATFLLGKLESILREQWSGLAVSEKAARRKALMDEFGSKALEGQDPENLEGRAHAGADLATMLEKV